MVWELPLDAVSAYGAITSNPIVVGNTIYFVDQEGNVWAASKETGKVRWRRDYGVPTVGPNGVAIGYGVLVSVLGDTAEVVALDASSGKQLWRRRISDQDGIGITMAPLIYGESIVVGTEPGGNSNFTYVGGAGGSLFCLDLHTGATRWKWNTTTDDLWGNSRVNSGGGIWYPPSVDQARTLYIGTGNAAPFPGTKEFPNGTSRPGPNDYASSLVALDFEQGELLWHINMAPHNLFDHDNQHTPIVATVTVDGQARNVVFSSGKHGYVVAAERETGVELWRTAVGHHENDHLNELPNHYLRVSPGVFGGVESPLAFADGMVFAAALNLPTEYSSVGYNHGSIDIGAARGQIVALDGATGAHRWQTDFASGPFGAGPTVANDVAFVGAIDGLVRGYNTQNGTLLWSHQFDVGLNAPFAIAGEFLIVPAGSFLVPSPDSTRISWDESGSPRLVAFRLES